MENSAESSRYFAISLQCLKGYCIAVIEAYIILTNPTDCDFFFFFLTHSIQSLDVWSPHRWVFYAWSWITLHHGHFSLCTPLQDCDYAHRWAEWIVSSRCPKPMCRRGVKARWIQEERIQQNTACLLCYGAHPPTAARLHFLGRFGDVLVSKRTKRIQHSRRGSFA